MQALDLVARRAVEWRPEVGPSGGYTGPDGVRLEPRVLVALWQLTHHHLIVVDGGRVLVTVAGHGLLSGWDGGLDRG